MNERLEIRLGEYLLSRNVRFDWIESVELCSDTRSLDIWYRSPEGGNCVELFEVEDFLTFLVTGGK